MANIDHSRFTIDAITITDTKTGEETKKERVGCIYDDGSGKVVVRLLVSSIC